MPAGGNGGDDPRNDGARRSGIDLRHRRKVRRRGRLPPLPTGTVCAAEHCENNKYTPASTAARPAPAYAPDAFAVRSLPVQRQQCFGGCTADGNCSPGNVCVGTSAGRSRTASSAPAGGKRVRTTARRASAARRPAASACRVVRAGRGDGGVHDRPDQQRPTPSQSCVDEPQAPAAPTAGAPPVACQLYGQGTPCA